MLYSRAIDSIASSDVASSNARGHEALSEIDTAMRHSLRRQRCSCALHALATLVAALAAAHFVQAQQPAQHAGSNAAAQMQPSKNPPVANSASVVGRRVQTPASEFIGPPYNPIEGARAASGQPADPAAPKTAKAAPTTPQPTVQLKPGEVPAIRFDTPTYDFGSTRAGPDIQHEFWFTNTGNGPLEILSVKPS